MNIKNFLRRQGGEMGRWGYGKGGEIEG